LNFLKPLYIQPRFFYAGIGIVVLFGLSYFIPVLFNIAQLSLVLLAFLFVVDILIIFLGKNNIEGTRTLPDKFSNGDENSIQIHIANNYSFSIYLEVIDEIPEQFQVRDFKITQTISSKKSKSVIYQLRPTKRGEYYFGNLNIYASSVLNLVAKRFTFNNGAMVPTYPSFKQL